MIKNTSIFLIALLRFCFRKITWKAKFSEFFTSKKHFDVYFQWNACAYSWKYVVKQGKPTPNWSKVFQTFWSLSSVLVLEKQPKKLHFQIFLSLRNIVVASFKETRAPASWKYVVEKDKPIPNWSKIFETFLQGSSVFTLEKQHEKLNFLSFSPLSEPLKKVHQSQIDQKRFKLFRSILPFLL